MNKKLYFTSLISGTLLMFMGISLVFVENDKKLKGHAEENAFAIALDADNAYSSGNVVTQNSVTGAPVEFTYANCVEEENAHVCIRDGGTVGNTYVIHSINAFYTEFEGSLQVSISYNQVDWSDYQDIESGSTYSTGAAPYFIQLKANGEDTILKEFLIGYSCEINEDAEPGRDYAYKKITKASELVSGNYLIGFDHTQDNVNYVVFFDSSLSSPDVDENFSMAYLEDDGYVYGTSYTDKAVVSIDTSAKTIKCPTGKYIGASSNTNVLSTSTSAYKHTALSINSDGSFQATCNKAVLRFALTSTQTRFRYYKSSSYSSYKKVYLYKQIDLGPSARFTRISAVEKNINSFETYKSYNQVSDLFVTIFDEKDVEYILPEDYYTLYIFDENNNYISPDKPFENAGTYTAVVASGNFIPVTYTFEVKEGTPIVKDDWTVMIYMCGSDLESDNGLASSDIEEILAVNGQPNDVNIVIETGGSSEWKNYGISATNIQRYHIENKGLVLDQSLTYSSMAIPSTLESFIEYGINEYPAEKYGFIFWNHGGAMEGVCYDEVNAGDSEYEGLTTYEVNIAFANAFNSVGFEDKFEFIGYDACLMQIQEAALFNAQYANYMIASQESETGYGWDYDTWVDDLYAGKSTLTFLQACVDGFIAENGGSSTKNNQTLSVLDLTKMDAYFTAWEALASVLKTKITTSTSWTTFKNVVNQALKFGYDSAAYKYNNGYRFDIFDVGTFISAMQSNSTYSTSCATQLSNLKTALNNLVVYVKNGGKVPTASGLCFFCPLGGYEERAYATADYNGFTTWCSIIYNYGKFYG